MIINLDGFGLRGLNKGLTSTLGRHGIFNMIYFGFYFNVKDILPASQVKKCNLRGREFWCYKDDNHRTRTVIKVQTDFYSKNTIQTAQMLY